MEKKTLTVDIISSCICRDCFEIGKRSLSKNQYKIDIFFQATSPFTIYSPSDDNLRKIEADDLVFGTPWQRRLIIAELRKTMFERFGNDKRDGFLVLDCTDFARNLYKLDNDVYLLETDMLQKNLSVLKGYRLEKIHPWDLSKEFLEDKLERFANDIKQRYDLDKVVMCETYYLDKYAASDGTIKSFATSSSKLNEFVAYCYEYLENALGKEQIHVISMPNNVLSNERHKWGNSSRHFCDEYYKYLLSAIDCCMCNYERQDEAEMLFALKDDCESAFSRYYVIDKLSKELTALKGEKESCLVKLRDKEKQLQEERQSCLVKLRDKEKQLQEEKENVLQLSKEIENIKDSKSYRIGRFFTYIPRKMRKKDKK